MEQAENLPEWGSNPNHVCDELCALWAEEARARETWQADVEAALSRHAARCVPMDLGPGDD
jgi:hypothetical protein